jgi:putative Mg2+ transporter-C (MgtC) family protein
MDAISVPGSTTAIIVRLLLATGLGLVIGLNRELQQKPAGLRTHALVALGAALFALVGLELTQFAGGRDPSALSRIAQGIVAGVGFIGGGVILRREDTKGVHGLSTAASIWIVAAAGLAAGCGLWRSSIATIVIALTLLMAGGAIERALHARPASEDDAQGASR